jgi:hypothetical protein
MSQGQTEHVSKLRLKPFLGDPTSNGKLKGLAIKYAQHALPDFTGLTGRTRIPDARLSGIECKA